MAFGVVDKTGKVTRLDTFEAPYASMIHDFFVTRNYAMIPVMPLTGSMERAMSGQPPFAWDPALGLAYRRAAPRRARRNRALVHHRSLLRLPPHEHV